MIKVLHSVSNMDRAGIETMIMNYYRNINRDDIQFIFLCNKSKKGAYDEEIKKYGGKIYISPGFNPFKLHKYGKLVQRIIKENPEIKIIHAHNGPLQFFALYYAKKYGIKIRISHAHSTKIPFSNKYFDLKKLYKKIIKNKIKKVANYYWGCSTEAIEFYFGKKILEKKQYQIIRNAIDLDKYSYDSEKRKRERAKLGINDEDFVIGHVGRFTTEKNQEFIIKVFSEVLKREPKAKLLLIGDGYLEKKIKSEVGDMNLTKSVIFTGSVDDTYNKYQAMDVFVLPSLFEGLPVVGIEAQANGLKCIFSDNVSKETDITGNAIFYNLQNKIDEWADILVKNTARDLDVEKKIVSNGYSIKNEAKIIEKMYKELVYLAEKE